MSSHLELRLIAHGLKPRINSTLLSEQAFENHTASQRLAGQWAHHAAGIPAGDSSATFSVLLMVTSASPSSSEPIGPGEPLLVSI